MTVRCRGLSRTRTNPSNTKKQSSRMDDNDKQETELNFRNLKREIISKKCDRIVLNSEMDKVLLSNATNNKILAWLERRTKFWSFWHLGYKKETRSLSLCATSGSCKMKSPAGDHLRSLYQKSIKRRSLTSFFFWTFDQCYYPKILT